METAGDPYKKRMRTSKGWRGTIPSLPAGDNNYRPPSLAPAKKGLSGAVGFATKSAALGSLPEGNTTNMMLQLTQLPLTADAVHLQQRGLRDYRALVLKERHQERPIWACGDGFLLLEQFLPSSKQANDFLVTVAEPICRSELMHEFQLTVFSLYAAISVGLTASELLTNLNKLSKNILPKELVQQIQNVSAAFGKVYSFQVRAELVEEVKRLSIEVMQRPLLSEYDFRRDTKNFRISSLLLRSSTKIRYYQERALRKMFSNGRARSGIIVLPCGAGKTLTGITAACTLQKSTVVLTTSAVAVEQWKKQFAEYTSIVPDRLLTLTAETKQQLWPLDSAGVLISTYTMLAFSGKRSTAAEQIMMQIKEREAHCRLGLTATLVREDDLIKDLQWIIGPKLYEANWIDLQNQASLGDRTRTHGYLAKVSCQEVWCPMTAEFYREYLRVPHAKQRKLWVCNPTKLMVCEFLLRFHESRGDKVIVFSDNVFALLHVARALNRPFIYGKVSPPERMAILSKFKNESTFNTLFLSKVGDNAIDIPCANVVIQISFNFASRRQEAQRLGRILRAKPRGSEEEGGFNAYFYSLISKDTLEMVYADKRQQFIIDQAFAAEVAWRFRASPCVMLHVEICDQGYSYRVLHCRDLPLEPQTLVYGDRERQLGVLRDIMLTDDADRSLDDDEDEGTYLPSTQQQQQQQQPTARLVLGGLAGLSGKFLAFKI
ncbi:tfiih basal transcription factor complex helicase xpb [Cyclospora cayetanensis]|uniref:DNA 3'-5' helicase n=1 Tax=Cyclospora cayetanensis TaxID=88456 RepID=A0A1D3D7K7_9EIME|nr:tfiih basal transcription factor complex helicase xpb [Cyclospora cayetanensis]